MGVGGGQEPLDRVGRPSILIRRIWPAAAAGLVGGLLAWQSWPPAQASHPALSPLAAVSRMESDTWFALRGPQRQLVDPRILVVGFDSTTESTLGRTWPPSRLVISQAVDRMRQDGAKVIALDILLEGPTAKEEDAALDRALRLAKPVLAARMDRDPDPRAKRKSLIGPYHNEADGIDFEAEAELGLAEVPADEDGVVRRMSPWTELFGERVPSFAAAVAMKTLGVESLDGLRIPRSGPIATDPVDASAIPSVSIAYPGGRSVLPQGPDIAETAAGRFARGTFRDKVVFVGVTGSQLVKELGDGRPIAATSLAPELAGGAYRRDLPGVHIQALHFNAIVRQTWLNPMPDWVRFLFGFLLGALGCFASRRWGDVRGLAVLAGILAAALVGSFLCFLGGFAAPMLAAASWTACASLGLAWTDRLRLKQKWSGYVSPSVFKLISETDGGALRSRTHATVMFADVRGFTSFSAQRDPEEVIELLNRHFERIAPAVISRNGTIDKFMGDGLLAVFGAPVPAEGSEALAAQAALEVARLAQQPLVDRAGQPVLFQVGIGLATGELVAGHVGGKGRHDFTIIGDVVNRASRIQGESGPGQVVMDQATRDGLPDSFEARLLKMASLKGIEGETPIHLLEAGGPEALL